MCKAFLSFRILYFFLYSAKFCFSSFKRFLFHLRSYCCFFLLQKNRDTFHKLFFNLKRIIYITNIYIYIYIYIYNSWINLLILLIQLKNSYIYIYVYIYIYIYNDEKMVIYTYIDCDIKIIKTKIMRKKTLGMIG